MNLSVVKVIPVTNRDEIGVRTSCSTSGRNQNRTAFTIKARGYLNSIFTQVNTTVFQMFQDLLLRVSSKSAFARVIEFHMLDHLYILVADRFKPLECHMTTSAPHYSLHPIKSPTKEERSDEH